ncbi:hypothetical protein SAMN05444355_105198 [Flavobacterium frigoris]|uniref:Uncharacterized protein n=1 Tax=Flavobacterium frigoris TaxID=229204 RepID=A0A1H9K8X7_FLAFI|nr:hypothetical protein SAMN05444355_105198 [Flavobacterium frigoris]
MSFFFSSRLAHYSFSYQKGVLCHGEKGKNSFSIINFVPLNKYFNST